MGGEIFRSCPDRLWGPSSVLYNGYQVFPGVKERPGRDADPSPPTSAVGHERLELLPLWAVQVLQSLTACTRVKLTFTYTSLIHLRFVVPCIFNHSIRQPTSCNNQS
jgi:hypothetical protein